MTKVGLTTQRQRGSYKRPKQGIYKYVHKQLISLWKDSVAAFVTTAVGEMSMDVDTGMSVASFYPLGAQVKLGGYVNTMATSLGGPKKGVYEWETGSTARYNATGMRSISAGKALGQRAYSLDFGNPQRPVFRFTFEIVVWQHWLHEAGRAGKGTHHWDSLKKGQEAFLEFFNSNYTNYVQSDMLVKLLEEYLP